MSGDGQDNGKPPSERGGPRSDAGKRRASLNSLKHGLAAIGSAVPPVSRCPLKDSPFCECGKEDPVLPCPRFLALEQALTATFLKVPHIKTNRGVWPLVRELVKNLVSLEVADCFVARVGFVRAHQGALDTHPLEVRRATRAAETRRLFEVLGISPVSMRALRVPGPAVIDLPSVLMERARRAGVVPGDGGEEEGGSGG